MPGQAARVGDQTTHGGSITGPGEPTVLIGGKPAVRIGDMQACPMMSGTVPHGSTPIMQGVQSVLIGGKPAATSGDMAGPPCAGSIAVGCPTVLIGTDPPTNASQGEHKKEDMHEFYVVVKDAEGNILANEEFHFTAPDGSVINGQTNAQGEIYICNLSSGSCKLQIRDRQIEV